MNHPGPFFIVVCFCSITLFIIIIYCLFLISGTLCIFCCNLNLNFWCFTPFSAIFQLYHGDQFTKPGANARRIGDRLVWAVRSNDLTHWTTRDIFFPFFVVVCFCLITLCIIIIYCLFLISGTLCIFCCNLNFWCFMPLSAIFHLYQCDQFLGVALVYYMFILDYIVYWL